MQRLLHTVLCFVVADVLAYIVVFKLDPMFFPKDGAMLPLDTYRWPWLALNFAIRGLNAYLIFVIQDACASILFVGLGLSEPRAWPAFCGSLLDAYTVRRFWG